MVQIMSGMIQFEGSRGQIVTTSLVGFSTVRGKDDYKAYWGTKGNATLTEAEYDNINNALSMPSPVKAVVVDTDDDDDDDFTSP